MDIYTRIHPAIALALCLSATSLVAADPGPFLSALSESFADWDLDHDGALATLEIDTALADPQIKGDSGAALAVMKRLARSKTWSPLPRTLDALAALAAPPKTKDEPDLGAMFADGQARITNASRELFTEGAPSLQKLQQGEMGNCFSLAPLGSMLSRDPAQVKAMFKQPDDGQYAVMIGQHEVRVAAPTDAEIALSSSSERTGLWSNVYEKAAGVARNAQRAAKDRVTTPLDAIARGGSAGTMLAFITGHEMERFTLKWAKDSTTTEVEVEAKLGELRRLLSAAFAEHRCVTTGTLKPSMPGLRGGHAYGVIGFNEATDEIRVWDPHGDTFTPQGAPGPDTGYPRDDGICDLPLTLFVKQFSGLAFEQLKKQPDDK